MEIHEATGTDITVHRFDLHCSVSDTYGELGSPSFLWILLCPPSDRDTLVTTVEVEEVDHPSSTESTEDNVEKEIDP